MSKKNISEVVEDFKCGDRVTRSKKNPHYKYFEGICGTVVEVVNFKGRPNRYKIKWDKKSGKWIPNCHFGTFFPDRGQQHSTLLGKYLVKVV